MTVIAVAGLDKLVGRRVELREHIELGTERRAGVVVAAYVGETAFGYDWGGGEADFRSARTRVTLVVDLGDLQVVDVPMFAVTMRDACWRCGTPLGPGKMTFEHEGHLICARCSSGQRGGL